jgi:hypothetical protein
MFCNWHGDVVLMTLGALVMAWPIQHLGHRRGFAMSLRFFGWALGAGLVAIVALTFGGSPDETWARNCGQSEFMGQTVIHLTFGGRLLVWSALYATALAACWLVYRLVASRQRVTP